MKLLSPISGGIKRRRLGECAPVYLAAVIHSALKIRTSVLCMLLLFCISPNQVLEYMTAELVEAAGLQAKKAKVKNKKQGVLMISPSHIVQAVSGCVVMKRTFYIGSSSGWQGRGLVDGVEERGGARRGLLPGLQSNSGQAEAG